MQLEIDIDNQKLDGFMEHFLTHSCNCKAVGIVATAADLPSEPCVMMPQGLSAVYRFLEAVAEEGVAI